MIEIILGAENCFKFMKLIFSDNKISTRTNLKVFILLQACGKKLDSFLNTYLFSLQIIITTPQPQEKVEN